MMVSNRNLLFQGSIFRFHVCFGGCIDDNDDSSRDDNENDNNDNIQGGPLQVVNGVITPINGQT